MWNSENFSNAVTWKRLDAEMPGNNLLFLSSDYDQRCTELLILWHTVPRGIAILKCISPSRSCERTPLPKFCAKYEIY